MNLPFRHAIVFLFLAITVQANGQTLHEHVMATYNFSPRTLDDKALETKSAELDVFWEQVKANPQGLEELRKELHRADLPVFFNYDGAKLLLSLSNSHEDRSLALSAIARADLQDLQWNDYFYTVHALAVDGLDTSDAALKILSESKFKIFVPQHALTLGQDFCLLYLLLPTDEAFYLDKLVQRLSEEKDITAQKSLLLVLGYSVTTKGDEAVKRFAEDSSKPEESRAYAKKIMKSVQSMAKSPFQGLSLTSFEKLKVERRKLLARISDEALEELEGLQVKLRAKGAR